MGDDGPDGFYVRKADLAIIAVNSDKRLGRQRFTASHELAHHLFDRRSQVDGDVLAGTSIPERRANAFAAFFLMPRAGVGRWLDEERRRQGGAQPRIDAEVVVHLVQHFGLSYEATLHQLRDLGRLRPTEVRELRAEQPERTARRLGYDVEAEVRERHRRVLPRGFVRRAFAAYGDGHISLARLAELLRTSEAEAHKLAGEAGIELAERSLDELLEEAGRA
jgi:Zn-dependent peptidase ImmA (M78 family)